MIKIEFLGRNFFVIKFYFLQPLFKSAQHFYEKREGSGSGSLLVTKGSRSGTVYDHICAIWLRFIKHLPTSSPLNGNH
jgi:hypothetical protein